MFVRMVMWRIPHCTVQHHIAHENWFRALDSFGCTFTHYSRLLVFVVFVLRKLDTQLNKHGQIMHDPRRRRRRHHHIPYQWQPAAFVKEKEDHIVWPCSLWLYVSLCVCVWLSVTSRPTQFVRYFCWWVSAWFVIYELKVRLIWFGLSMCFETSRVVERDFDLLVDGASLLSIVVDTRNKQLNISVIWFQF